MKRMCNIYKINHSFSMPYFPHGNDHVKATNKMIIIILKKTIKENHQNWYECIPYALWAYHTIIQMPLSATPFSLIYGTEAIISLELEILSLHVSLKDFCPDEESHWVRLDQLTFLNERCINAIKHHKIYQEHLK